VFWYAVLQGVAVAIFGSLLGATELLSRYRDAPFEALTARASHIYIGLNGLIAVASLILLQTVASGIVPGTTDTERDFYAVLIAGFGGAALFRSAIVRSKIGDADVGIGPSFVIETLLGVTDREIDRERGNVRANQVTPIMIDLPSTFVSDALVPYCLSLLQNLSAQERENIDTKVNALSTKKIDPGIKPVIVGLLLVNLVGFSVLDRACVELGSLIKKAREAAKPIPAVDETVRAIEAQATNATLKPT